MLKNEKFTFNLQYGRAALEAVMKSILRHETPVVSPPSAYKGNFFDGKNIKGIIDPKYDDHYQYYRQNTTDSH